MRTHAYVGAEGNRLVGDDVGDVDAPAVLLLHGGGQTRHSWSETQTTLARSGCRAIAIDLRGHGDSDWVVSGNYSTQAFADDVTAVVQQIGRPPVHVGASLGGVASLLALGQANDQSALGTGLVLVDVAHRTQAVGRERIVSFMRSCPEGYESLDDAAAAISEYNPNRASSKTTAGLEKNLRLNKQGRWIWHWDPNFLSESGGSSAVEIEGLERQLLPDAARNLKVPTLVVRGRSSDLLSQEVAEEFLGLVSHAEFSDVAGAGHMVAGDRNDVFNVSILKFIADQISPQVGCTIPERLASKGGLLSQ